MIDRKTFLSLLSKRLYPILRSEGFKGSGTTLRRIDGPIIHIFNVQGSSGSNQCYLNLGVHLSFLPPEGGGTVISEKMDEPSCAFRGRIEPPSGAQYGWSYCNSMEEALENIEFIVSEWPTVGKAFFDRYIHFPESFVTLVTETSPSTLHPRECLHYARIANELGLPDVTTAFAKSGLERAGERATLLKADLSKLLTS